MRTIAERVWFWTHGQPYLSQKIFRALARRSDEQLSDEVVDKIVGGIVFCTPDGGPQDEPHLTSISKHLLRESREEVRDSAPTGVFVKAEKWWRIRRWTYIAICSGQAW